jgi:hypothetical protein
MFVHSLCAVFLGGSFKTSNLDLRHFHRVRSEDRWASCLSGRGCSRRLAHHHSDHHCTQVEASIPASPRSSLCHLWVLMGRPRGGRLLGGLCRPYRGAPRANGSRPPWRPRSGLPPSSPLPRPARAPQSVAQWVVRPRYCPCNTHAEACHQPVKSSEYVLFFNNVFRNLTLLLLNVSMTLSASPTFVKPISAMTVGCAAMSLQNCSSPPTLLITLSISAAVVPGAKLLATTT